MSAKNLSPRMFCVLGLVCVFVIVGLLFLTTDFQNTLIGACVALLALIGYIIFKMSDGWMNSVEAEQIKSDQSRFTARIDRYRLSLSALPEGVVLFRQGHTVEWCNPAAEKHLGLKLTKHMGMAFNLVFDNPKIIEYLENGDFSKPIEVKSHEIGRILLLSAVVADKTHFIVVSRDITEQRRIDSMRKDFVANVSHELRTPLTVITGFLDMILRGKELDEKMLHEHLLLMQQESVRMQNLVNDLLSLSRLESKDEQQSDPPEVVNMPKLVAGLAEDGVALSRGRHTIDTDITANQAVLGQVDEIRSACLNLVTNAVRYTPDGGKIQISWHFNPDDQTATFAVKDNGIGIDAEDIPRLTERFYRVDKSRSREKGGTGLGLAIVKHVAIRNHCQLRIESEPGKGSTFSLVFPSDSLIN
ncbi:phosphate regulon sensor histidine kinase PhoR [Parasutterella secunda]|uniref:Phosphate regulon sensor protein PhoR n=1 Tax=Parasutterella secunda TaxID=626947 RepID=A0ABS2GSL3_9BURK|nr:phosphate regulon sensor histidine kinase PhoR [Parasutterella secunda]MBM6928835.1 phosphate regulon sensor histidine kinase PhoR [Parasutterella secunda]